MIGNRRYPRYPVSLRLRLQLGTGELETTTEEVSLAGMSAKCTALPETGTTFPFTVYLPDGKSVTGTAAAVRITPEGLAGFSLELPEAQHSVWSAFIAQEHGQGGVWRMLSRWASGGSDDGEVRSVRENNRGGVMRLHMVGENGEAYRIAFERHWATPPDDSPFAQASERIRDFARRTVRRVLDEEVQLKRASHVDIERVRLVEMLNGGYGYLVANPGGKPALMGLHGSELIVVEVDGKTVFPHFTAEDLERIAADNFRREATAEPKVAPAAPVQPAVREERFSDDYAHQHVDTQNLVRITHTELREAMAASQRRQERTYGPRTLKLFPDVWIEATRPGAWQTPVRGFAMEDGAALCIFVLVGEGAPRVVKLEGPDQVFHIRGGLVT
jgi:hypothetical protein